MHTVANSDRLKFRLMSSDDEAILWALDQDPLVMKYINGGKATSREDMRSIYLPRLIQYTSPAKGLGMWAVSTQATNEFIGWILVRPMAFFTDFPKTDNLELGWRFKQKVWGKGYATEAAEAVKASFIDPENSNNQYTVKVFSALALPDNEASIKIMRKLGMSYVKTDLYSDPLDDEVMVCYQVERPE
ncbi:GNAT family N-acetyltransferase [bacterium]|nr:GNAT family N-acetyltransferase [bacterium]